MSVWVVQWEEKKKCVALCLFYKDKDCIVWKRNFDSVDLWEICGICLGNWRGTAVCVIGGNEGEGWGGWAVGRTRGILVWFCGSWCMCLCDQKVDPIEKRRWLKTELIYDLKTLQCETYLLGPACMMNRAWKQMWTWYWCETCKIPIS